MTNPNIIALKLIGKTISQIKHYDYEDWPFCVDAITFTDGTVIEFSGNADSAVIQEVHFPNGEKHYFYEK